MEDSTPLAVRVVTVNNQDCMRCKSPENAQNAFIGLLFYAEYKYIQNAHEILHTASLKVREGKIINKTEQMFEIICRQRKKRL